MDKEELLRQVKVYLRSAIESSKRCIFLHEVPEQYESGTGKPLPFRELGFTSPIDLYNSMPDVVYISRTDRGPVLLTVPSERSAHIVNYVATQNECGKSRQWTANRPTMQYVSNISAASSFKMPPAKTNPPPNVPSFVAPRATNNPFYIQPHCKSQPQFNVGGKIFEPRQPYSDQHNVGFDQSTKPHVPESVKAAIRKIVRENPRGLLLSTLIQICNEREHLNLDPIALGYSDSLQFITSLNDVVKLRNTGKQLLILPVNVQPSNSYTPRNSYTPSRVSPKLAENDAHTDRRPRSCSSEVIRTSSAGDTIKLNSDESVAEKSKDTVVGFKTPTQDVTQSNLTDMSHTANSGIAQNRNIETKSSDSGIQGKCSETAIKYEERAKSVLMKIISNYPRGISMGAALKEFEKSTGIQLDVSKLKHKSATELLKSLPDILFLDGSGDPMECLFISTFTTTDDKRNSSSSSLESVQQSRGSCEEETEVQIDEGFLIKLLQVVCSAHNGLNLDGLEDMYKDIHGEELDVNSDINNIKEKYFLGLKDFFEIDCINDHTTIVKATPTGRQWLWLGDGNRPEIIRNYAGVTNGHPLSLEEQEVPASDDILQIDDLSLNEDMLFCKSVPFSSLPAGIAIDSHHRVFICTVVHPGKFFIQLEKDLELLELLQGEMNNTYGDPSMSSQYCIPPGFIQENCQIDSFHCVCYFEDGSWKRVEVMQFNSNETVEVTLIDFGSVATVSSSDLRFLRETFVTVPRLCFQSKLADSKGLSKAGWTHQAKRIFTDLCLDKILVARFKSVDIPLSLDLIDETEVTPVNILDVLEKEICLKHKDGNVASKDTSSGVISKPAVITGLEKLKEDKFTMTDRSPFVVNGASDLGSDLKELRKDSKCQDFQWDIMKSRMASSPKPSSDGLNEAHAKDNYKLQNNMEPIQSFTQTGDIRALRLPHDHAEDERCFGTESTKREDSKTNYNSSIDNCSNENLPEYFPVILSQDRTFQIVPVLLMGKQLLVINWFGVKYLQSFQISRLIWKADILKTMAEALLLDLQCITIHPKDNLKLFDTIIKFNDFSYEMVDGSEPEITLVPLKVLKDVLPQVVYTHRDAVDAIVDLAGVFS